MKQLGFFLFLLMSTTAFAKCDSTQYAALSSQLKGCTGTEAEIKSCQDKVQTQMTACTGDTSGTTNTITPTNTVTTSNGTAGGEEIVAGGDMSGMSSAQWVALCNQRALDPNCQKAADILVTTAP